MDTKEPIVILAMPRSGSSMVAGLFAAHGCWVGRCCRPDKLNPKGYFENRDVKGILLKRFGRLTQLGRVARPQQGFKQEVLKLHPKGNWIVKHSAVFWKAWHEFKPKFICVRRDADSILNSNLKTNFFDTKNRTKIHKLIDIHNQQMDCSGGVNIYTDALIAGDFSSIEQAFKFCEIDFHSEIVEAFVGKKLWHY